MLKCKCHEKAAQEASKGMAEAQRIPDEPASAFASRPGGAGRMALQPEHQPGTELKDTGRSCDERHMMVSGNLKRPEHQSAMNNVYKHL